MEVEHRKAKLLVEFSKSQDDEIGDGTPGVVVLAVEILEQTEMLREKGIHSTRISDGFEAACSIALNHMESIADEFDLTSSKEDLFKTTRISIDFNIASKCHINLPK